MGDDISNFMLKSGKNAKPDVKNKQQQITDKNKQQQITDKNKYEGARTLLQKLIQVEAQVFALQDRYSQSHDALSPIKVVFLYAVNGLPNVLQVSHLSFLLLFSRLILP
jgi:hypothetical protein